MTQSDRSSDKPSHATPKSPASPQDSGWVLAPGSEPFPVRNSWRDTAGSEPCRMILSSRAESQPLLRGYRDKIMSPAAPHGAFRGAGGRPGCSRAAAAEPEPGADLRHGVRHGAGRRRGRRNCQCNAVLVGKAPGDRGQPRASSSKSATCWPLSRGASRRRPPYQQEVRADRNAASRRMRRARRTASFRWRLAPKPANSAATCFSRSPACRKGLSHLRAQGRDKIWALKMADSRT